MRKLMCREQSGRWLCGLLGIFLLMMFACVPAEQAADDNVDGDDQDAVVDQNDNEDQDDDGVVAGPATVEGEWRVIKTIVGGSQVAPIDWSSDSPVPYGEGAGLEDGDSVFEDWSIVSEIGQLKLTSPYGSCYGNPTADGAFFEWQGEDPRVTVWGVSHVLTITIECHLSPNGEMYGGIINQLYVVNGIGVLTPAPPESWTFKATLKIAA